MRLTKPILFFCFILHSVLSFAQSETTPPQKDSSLTEIDTSRYVYFYNEVDPFEEFAPEEEEKEFKKKKPKKKLFYGIKTKKGYTKSGYGTRLTVEVFYYIPEYQEPVPYVKDVYSFNLITYEVQKGRKKLEPEYSRLLHGPYKKLINGEVVEQGVYYKGVKHARWEKWAKPKDYTFKDTIVEHYSILIDKQKYDRGWPKDSELSFYDKTEAKLKEAIPIVEGYRHGYYVSYYESGRMKEQGNYVHGQKAGTWISYYDKGKLTAYRKVVIKYPRNPLQTKEKGQIIKEWTNDGKVTYDYEKEKRRLGNKAEKRFVEEEE